MPTICMNFRLFLPFRVLCPRNRNVRSSSQLQVTIFFITGDLFLPTIFKIGSSGIPVGFQHVWRDIISNNWQYCAKG